MLGIGILLVIIMAILLHMAIYLSDILKELQGLNQMARKVNGDH